MIIKKLKEKKGMTDFIAFPIMLIVLVITVFLLTDFLTIFMKKVNLNTFSREIVREAEIYGNIGTEVFEREEELKTSLGLNPIIKYSKKGKLNLNEQFVITLTYNYKTPFLSVPFTMETSATGRSEIYRK